MMTQGRSASVFTLSNVLILLFVLFLAVTACTAASQAMPGPGARPPTMLTIQVKTANGKTLPNVTVVCINSSTNAVLDGARVDGGNERLQTDAEGRFRLPWTGTN